MIYKLSVCLIGLIGFLLLVLPSSPRKVEQSKFIVGDWQGVFKNETTFNGKTNVYTILINISFKENNLVKIEEVHLDDSRKNSTGSYQYKFTGENLIEIDGFEEKFVIYRKSDNEMTLDLTEEDRWKTEAPLICLIDFNRIN